MDSSSWWTRSRRSLLQLLGVIILAAAVGAATGSLVTIIVNDGPSTPQPVLSVDQRVEAINTLLRADWPYVSGADGWHNLLYNNSTPLEYEWDRLGERIQIDGVDLLRVQLEGWSEQYEDWVEEAGDVLRELPPSDRHYESVEAVYSRGRRILAHVDALLDE